MADSKTLMSKRSTKKVTAITPEECKKMISETAYYLAEQHGFGERCQLHDWLEAETKIDHIYEKAE
jgi:hypothetical protein